MYTSLTVASLLFAASGALAAPQETTSSYGDFSVDVLLQSDSEGAVTSFKNVNVKRSKPARGTGPFDKITITLGDNPANPDLRCAALDSAGNRFTATRGANTDTTFSDADKGEWLFAEPADVARIVCDPNFVAAPQDGGDEGEGDDTSIRVVLANSGDDLATQTVFEDFSERAALKPTGSSGPYSTVEIVVGADLDPELRCKLLNRRGRAIVATRGENIDTTFSDADKGEWTFKREQRVGRVICDPNFVAAPQ